MKYRKIVLVLFLGVFLLMSTSTFLWSGEPGDLVKNIVLKDISLKEGEGLEERKQELWGEISNSIDFEEIARRVLGKYWKERSPEEKKEFVELFISNVKGTCMRKTGPRFGEEIISLSEKQNNRYARVHIGLLKRQVEEVSADFRLIKKDGRWQICDLIYQGVSLVHNYRSQIYSFLAKSSYEELVHVLKHRQS
ncbi:MAG: ABC transporter substrate-binding protein [Candidatus Scalindua sp.]|jgi:phospholipid transport system substrate-binding protein|nr:ABC transporter substrate-binding protein [Candidatus Scalindua sp.]MDV5165355.1 ABC transporter substrate-binding protein [Candidatus Scalindua sp.]